MEQMTVSFGAPGDFHVIVEWRHDYGSAGPIGKTWGDLQLWIGNTLIWGEPDGYGKTKGVTWSWVDLLEFFGNAWSFLEEEEQCRIPFGIDEEPRHLGQLSGNAKLRWRKLTDEVADQEDEILRDFLAVHDLSEGLHGISLPRLLCLRRGRQMIAATPRQEFVLSFEKTMATFKCIADEISQRLADLADQRSVIACNRWLAHDVFSQQHRLKIATGMSIEHLRKIWPQNMDALVSNDKVYELKAAARMLGRGVSDEHLKAILEKIHRLGSNQQLNIGSLAEKAHDVILAHENETPAFQGYFLAEMLRDHLGNLSRRVDPDKILRSWGVEIQEFPIPDSNLDAVAVWGACHTPTILLNPVGPRSRQVKGQRVTLAHEMCHILVDLDGALPVVDVLGLSGNVHRAIEQRANAFAAEFLLPRFEGFNFIKKALNFVYDQAERNTALERAIGELAEVYGLSHETVAWQILNSHSVESKDRPVFEKKLKSVYDPFNRIAC